MNDAEKREMVMRGLEKCTECLGCCSDECPYYSHTSSCSGVQLRRDALALLKEQEPRVMTAEEINKRAESLDPDPVFVQWRETGGTAWVVRSINIIAGTVNAGNRSVRAWTSRPSPEQMRDTPWEGEDDAEVH